MRSLAAATCLVLLSAVQVWCQEGYEESVHLRDVDEHSTHAVFNMSVVGWPEEGRYGLWSKWWVQMADHVGVEKLHLSMVRGVWRWGHRDIQVPPACTLQASFANGTDIFPAWKVLVNSLSAATCASTNFLSPNTETDYTKPFLLPNITSEWDFWGTLPFEEMLCTENLTPLLALLPTNGRSGISSSLLVPQEFFKTRFHALHLTYTRKASMSIVAEGVYPKEKFKELASGGIDCPLCTSVPEVVRTERTVARQTLLEVFSIDKGDAEGSLSAEIIPGDGVKVVNLTLLLPVLFLQPYVSTFRMLVGKEWVKAPGVVSQVTSDVMLIKATFKASPGVPIHVRLRYDKRLLPLASYPPDANRNYYLPPSFVTTDATPTPIYNTKPAGVTLPTPDFSMPFNIITLTCTVLALIFGMGFNPATKDFVF
eukprot:TRINITY_DN4371_c3_g1_i1.p1 TRINITY_DN4371_c3_g1~~TRINITY_DN4371_c3_g1_i1.p1  ORF type:complete len:425 (+),score=111.00 TRINITY_DN4371_c3_g1_i1:39-1313(+)